MMGDLAPSVIAHAMDIETFDLVAAEQVVRADR